MLTFFLHVDCSSDVILDLFPVNILHMFLLFVEGCLENQSLLPRFLLIIVAQSVICKVFTAIRDHASSKPSLGEKVVVFGASDLMFRMKSNFELSQLTVSVSHIIQLLYLFLKFLLIFFIIFQGSSQRV